MPSVTMGLIDAKNLAAALVPHASGDGYTPVLGHIALGGSHEKYAVASDRYTVGRYDLTGIIIGDLPTEEFLIPAKILSAVRALGPSTLADMHAPLNYRVVVETLDVGKLSYYQAKVLWHDNELGDIVHWMRTWVRTASVGTFPPVDRLFRLVKVGTNPTAMLSPEHVDKFTRYARSIGEKVVVTMTEGSGEKVNSPLLVEIGRRFKGLLQPNLIIDRHGLGPDLIAENVAADEAAATQVLSEGDGSSE